jgi:hypothetical protein
MNFLQQVQNPILLEAIKNFLPFVPLLALLIAWSSFLNATRQVRASEMPFLKLIYRKTPNNISPEFILQNVGKGVCHSINFEPLFLILTDIKVIWRLRLSLKESNILGVNDRNEVKLDLEYKEVGSKNKEGISTDLITYFYQQRNYPLNIYFQNSIGKLFVMRMSVGENMAKLISPPTEQTLGISSMIFLKSMFTYIKVFFIFYHWKIQKRYSKPTKSDK